MHQILIVELWPRKKHKVKILERTHVAESYQNDNDYISQLFLFGGIAN